MVLAPKVLNEMLHNTNMTVINGQKERRGWLVGGTYFTFYP